MATLSAINRALMELSNRAERAPEGVIEGLYLDAGSLLDQLASRDHQILFGRRGSGKTATLMALRRRAAERGQVAALIDLRMIGSSGVYFDPSMLVQERGTRLLADVLRHLFDTLANAAIRDDSQPWDEAIEVLERLEEKVAEVRVLGPRDRRSDEQGEADTSETLGLTPLRPEDSANWSLWTGELWREMEALVQALPGGQLWILFDEWSSVPIDLQPLLADLLRRTVFPVSGARLKIAATPRRTELTATGVDGRMLGIELDADVLSVDLDDGLAFGGDPRAAQAFFRELLFRHVRSRLRETGSGEVPPTAEAFELAAFDSPEALAALALAAEGLPRDALNMAQRAAVRALDRRIGVEDVRAAASEWYVADKEPAVRPGLESDVLLRWIFDRVIGGRRASGFLIACNHRSPLVAALEDARILHVIKRGVQAKDRPGIRYDAYRLDYGCYAHLLATSAAPQGLFRAVPDDADENTWVEVPSDQYRSVDDALLDPRLTPALIEEFEALITANEREEEYQRFLATHPVFLDPLASEVIPKQRLGLEHVTDYALRRHDERWVLVEIEKPNDPIVTAANDFASAFIHAFGQIVDFQRWVEANGAYARELMPGIASPRGLLVIGRRAALSQDARDKLRRFVTNSATIDVLTFDDLAVNARNLYKNLNGGD